MTEMHKAERGSCRRNDKFIFVGEIPLSLSYNTILDNILPVFYDSIFIIFFFPQEGNIQVYQCVWIGGGRKKGVSPQKHQLADVRSHHEEITAAVSDGRENENTSLFLISHFIKDFLSTLVTKTLDYIHVLSETALKVASVLLNQVTGLSSGEVMTLETMAGTC